MFILNLRVFLHYVHVYIHVYIYIDMFVKRCIDNISIIYIYIYMFVIDSNLAI